MESPYCGDVLGTAENVLIYSEVSSFQKQFCTQLYLAGTLDGVLIKGVPSQRGSTAIVQQPIAVLPVHKICRMSIVLKVASFSTCPP